MINTETQRHREVQEKDELGEEKQELNDGLYADLTREIIGAAIEVHRHLGPGLFEHAYAECLCHELRLRGIPFIREVDLPISYKGIRLDWAYRADLIVDGKVIVELKAADGPVGVHEAQLLTYLRASRERVGLLINFSARVLRDGILRRVL